MFWISGFQPGFPGTQGLRQHSPGVPLEVIKMLQSTVYFNSPVQICEQGFLEPLEYILGVPLPKELKTTVLDIWAFQLLAQVLLRCLRRHLLGTIDGEISDLSL